MPIAVLDDNYSYLIIDTITNAAAVVDPADPAAVKVDRKTLMLTGNIDGALSPSRNVFLSSEPR